ncbi:MFS transporter [Streptomyces sp. NPDC056105]|uniref:MFS transporter n=1 Tax=Streptomyces sp. NPDC056105 TaxID=3345714 RepID=UPI0035DE8C1B
MPSLDTPATVPAAAPVPGADAPRSFIAMHWLALFGAWLGVMPPAMVSLAVKIQSLDGVDKVSTLSWATGLGALFALTTNPLFGLLSDRTTSRFGARRPWMVIGILIGIAGLVVIATASTGWQITLGWCVVQTGYNAVIAPTYGALADQVPERQMGTVTGLLALSYPLAVLVGTWLVNLFNHSALWMLIAPALAGAALTVPFLLLGRDRRITRGETSPLTAREFAGFLVFNPVKHPDFGWAWLSRFLMWSATATLTTYMAYYLSDTLRQSDDGVTHWVFITTLVSTLLSLVVTVPAGRLSDRIGRRKPIVAVSAVLVATGLLLLLPTHGIAMFLIATTVFYLGVALYYAVDIALPTDVLPSRETAAKDLGVMNIAATLPSSLVPAIAPALVGLGHGGYSPLFVLGAVLALLAVPAAAPIRRR